MIPFSLLFVGLSSLLGCLGALMVGRLVPAVSATALALALGLSIFLAKNWKLKLKARPVSVPVFLLYALIACGIYFHSVFLFFQKGEFYWIQNPFNLGDMSFHWGTIHYLEKGATFWPENPIYLGYRFKYPFGMDFFNALWGNLGVKIHFHLPLVTLAMLGLILYVLHLTGGPLLVFAIFFSGGFFNFFTPGPWEPTRLQEGLDFKNLFLTVLLTQRGFLFALPAGVYLYRALQKAFAKEWTPTVLEKIVLGVIWGSLGFFHLHSFFFLSLYLGILILSKRSLKEWSLPIAVASLLGIPFVINSLWPEAGTMPLIHWSSRGWARPENRGYFQYWAQNMGPWLAAVLACGGIFYRAKKWDSLLPTALALVLFALFSHLILAPWAWDNIKLLLWCYVLALMAMADVLWNERSAGFQTTVFAALCGPGILLFVSSLPAFYQGTQWVSERELNKAALLLQGQDVNRGILVAPHYEHPALLLGYKLYMGYPGHVWSHGYNYVEREHLINRLYAGGLVAQTFSQEGVGLVYRGTLEKRREVAPFEVPGLTKIKEAGDHDLYRVEAAKE